MNELIAWLNANKIMFGQLDNEVIEIEDFGKVFVADLSSVNSIFKGEGNNIRFNLMENPEVLIDEGIFYVAFSFGRNWYYYDVREEFCFNILKYVGKRQPCRLGIPFVNLGIHTPYELLNGSGDLKLWVRKAKYLGQTALGICDYNTMAATLNFQKECVAAGIKHVFGYSFSLAHIGEKVDMKIYSLTQKGLRNMLRMQRAIMVDSEEHTLTLEELMEYAEGNVLVFGKRSGFWLKQNRHVIALLRNVFPKLFFQVDLSEYKAERIDSEVLHSVGCFFENFGDPITFSFEIEPILICDTYYPDKDDARNKILLNKIGTGAAHEQSDEQYFKDVDEHFAVMEALFSEKWNVTALFERMCGATVDLAEEAEARYETGEMYMPEYRMTEREKELYLNRRAMFHGLLEKGLREKVSASERDRYERRLNDEVYIIESTNNVDYFLIQWDMVSEARRRNIAVGIGRGSAGGSLVSYLLGITSIDPLAYGLLFSRFLVPERCGLLWSSKVTVVGEDIGVSENGEYVEIVLDGHTYRIDTDAKFSVWRDEAQIEVYADELREGDDIVFDRRDLIWTLNQKNNVQLGNNR